MRYQYFWDNLPIIVTHYKGEKGALFDVKMDFQAAIHKTLKITMMVYVLEVAFPFNSRQVY